MTSSPRCGDRRVGAVCGGQVAGSLDALRRPACRRSRARAPPYPL